MKILFLSFHDVLFAKLAEIILNKMLPGKIQATSICLGPKVELSPEMHDVLISRGFNPDELWTDDTAIAQFDKDTKYIITTDQKQLMDTTPQWLNESDNIYWPTELSADETNNADELKSKLDKTIDVISSRAQALATVRLDHMKPNTIHRLLQRMAYVR